MSVRIIWEGSQPPSHRLTAPRVAGLWGQEGFPKALPYPGLSRAEIESWERTLCVTGTLPAGDKDSGSLTWWQDHKHLGHPLLLSYPTSRELDWVRQVGQELGANVGCWLSVEQLLPTMRHESLKCSSCSM